MPRFSPDGKKIAFVSDRSGTSEIWIAYSDGSNPVQLTFFRGAPGAAPQWSSDGRSLVFDVIPGGYRTPYILRADGGEPRRLTSEPGNQFYASWSRDGRWIYHFAPFAPRGVWRRPAEGGAAQQVIKGAAREAFESFDGKFLYHTKFQQQGIWRVPAPLGGEEIQVLDQGHERYWSLSADGIYLLNQRPARIDFFRFATRRLTQVAALPQEDVHSFTVSPDGRWIVFESHDRNESDILLVENFR
jgi:Tol biopolymer transport system component